ncbi:major histocompatibility complex class I-related gene protein-like [Pelmatolapia mariae]|uniref:major histocompatibility complex class I-related gene protein-like n=1 Tax=Pelmatolapia mariae TaxID=158779 RepID=UPI003211E1DC
MATTENGKAEQRVIKTPPKSLGASIPGGHHQIHLSQENHDHHSCNGIHWGVPKISEHIVFAVVDDTEVFYCDASKKMFEPRQEWVKKMFDNNSQLLLKYTHSCFEHQPKIFKNSISYWKQMLNQSEGVHILQAMTGCNVNENSGEVAGFLQIGFNGEGFFEFDPKTKTMIALKPELQVNEQMMNDYRDLVKYIENAISTIYPEELKIFLNYGSSSLKKTVLPSVSLLQKTPSSSISCHTTGFYPDRGIMFWRKDGEELHEDVDPGEILSNNDGTFQMSVDLKLSSVTPEDRQRYDCVFRLSAVNEHIITKLDKTAIRTNWGKTGLCCSTEKPADTVTFISAAVIVLTVTIITVVAFVAYKKKKAPDDGPEQSERLNPQS